MLESATKYYQYQQRLTASGVIAARRARTAGTAEVVRVITAYQLAAARAGADSVAPMLTEQGLATDPVAGVATTSLAGRTPDGRPLDGLMSQTFTDSQFAMIVATQLQDVGRLAAALALVTDYGATGYARMLNPPSCARCAVLAGKWYRWNAGFDRHPNCDCIHVPSQRDVARTLLTNPNDAAEAGLLKRSYTYTNKDGVTSTRMVSDLTRAQQRALADGADISQVINVYRSKGILVDYGGTRGVARSSTEGVTRFGLAYRGRTGRRQSARLTPWTIYRYATSREDAIRLLRLNGYIL